MKGSTNASARPNIRIQDASAEFVANTDTDTNAEFPYRASVSITGVTHYMSATVIYSQAQCISGAYATYCQTYDGGVYLYAKTNVGTQTIPAISCDISVNYINVENVPTEDSQAVITSGGVYDALHSNPIVEDVTSLFTSNGITVNGVVRTTYGPFVRFTFASLSITNGMNVNVSNILPTGYSFASDSRVAMFNVNNGNYIGEMYNFNNKIYFQQFISTGAFYGDITFICNRS